ncbi:MAG: SpoIIE family protein phosphatase [Acidobacteriaceae bacterium]|nr:SpoIIE family protein phosphatase [Acidobacteriaceae bacterium]
MRLLITGPDASSRTVELAGKPVTIGRAADNELSYPNDPALSRYHLCLEPSNSGWQVRDCGSRNGTVVNATVLTGTHSLNPGDRIFAGQLTIDVLDKPSDSGSRIVTFVPQESGGIRRAATIVTSLEEVLGKAREGKEEDSKLGTARAVSALIRAGQELASHRPLEELFDTILDLALSAVNARRGLILANDANGTLSVRASRGEDFSISGSVRDQVLRERAALLIKDAQFEQALRTRESIVAQRVRSILAVPLQTNEEAIGLIYVDNGTTYRPFSQEDLELLTVMANVAAIRIEHARLAAIEQQEKLMQLQLAQASEIQQGLLPPGSPDVEGYEIAGFNVPCWTVGGDYYDFLPYPDGRLALCIADVCGKGLPAALMMSSLQARVQMLVESAPPPAAALTALNRNVAPRFPLGRFITVFFGVLDPSRGVLEYANAGHNYPLLLRANGEVERIRGGGLVLGLAPDVQYAAHELLLNPGDTLLLYSDGVTEAPSSTGEFFGEHRLANYLKTVGGSSGIEVIRQLLDRVRAWFGAPALSDDLTVVVVRRR